MSDRFKGLDKIPAEPAARMLVLANARLGVKLSAPAAALVPEVLAELEEKGAVVDMLRMLAVALPARERVWWACLAAHDLVNAGLSENETLIEAVEAWVFKPSTEALIKVRRCVDAADPDDGTALAGHCALNADGRLGPEELAQFEAPPGASATYALVINAQSLCLDSEKVESQGQLLIDRALDIARGGQGDVGPKDTPPPPGGAPGATDGAAGAAAGG
ncbi:DUF6931 family protein [Frigidibacter sp. ROC022]|uniref:DUF6931 family protein n=1 Tax=Frigidibacter sp. ROC022 TaxID=2971796 RepID=UPI00215AAE2D|nr:hypothetical protein [Frigidibacter sp. ROC022]MCR8723336.1 hypothetical protein [Frigidibacter sp. ROC022]